MDQTTLDTEWVSIDALQPHPRNARNGDIEAIADSLRANGQFRPIVVAEDGTILAGNHTYAAAMSLGWKQMAVVRLPVSPESPQAIRVLLADNRTADRAVYDEGLLVDLLQSLEKAEGSLYGSGYDSDDVTGLLAKIADDYDEPSGHPYGAVFMLIVTCRTEEEQASLIEEMTARGLSVRAGVA